jgi:hypothetical protein
MNSRQNKVVKTDRTLFLLGNRSVHYNTELHTRKHVINNTNNMNRTKACTKRGEIRSPVR